MAHDITIWSTAKQMAAAVAQKDISARELLDLHLERIDEVNPTLNALVSIDPERARESAAAADEKTARGERLGPLHGVPYAVKDTHEVANWRSTFGSVLRAEHYHARDDRAGNSARSGGAVTVCEYDENLIDRGIGDGWKHRAKRAAPSREQREKRMHSRHCA